MRCSNSSTPASVKKKRFRLRTKTQGRVYAQAQLKSFFQNGGHGLRHLVFTVQLSKYGSNAFTERLQLLRTSETVLRQFCTDVTPLTVYCVEFRKAN